MSKKVTSQEFAALGVTANGREELTDVGSMMYRQGKDFAAQQGFPFSESVAPAPRIEWTEEYPEETQRFLADPDPNVQRAAQRHFMKD